MVNFVVDFPAIEHPIQRAITKLWFSEGTNWIKPDACACQ